MFKKLILLAVSMLFLAQLASAATYDVDPVHSQVHFSVAHLVVFTVRGNFLDFAGTVEIDEANKTLKSTTATIQAKSIDTRNEKRDNHLRSEDFFNTDKFPVVTFVSKKVNGSGNDITVVGDLTIRGTTKEVVLKGAYVGETKDPWGNIRSGFVASGKINRKDFGLTWNKVLETGGVTVGEEVEIGLEIEAIRQK